MEEKKEIWNYFEMEVEYPDQVAHNPLPYGTAWHYISSTFLNCFINYVKPISVYQIDRYAPETEVIEIDFKHTNGSGSLERFKGSKCELRKLLLEERIFFTHTDLSCFHDDIVILSEIENAPNDGIGRYMLFYFDHDISDCSIGKFETTDSKEVVIQSVVNWLENQKIKNIVNYTELPLSFLEGWITF